MMSQRVPTIKIYSPTSKKSRFTWHLPKPEVRQSSKALQIPRFFGTQPTNPRKDSHKPGIQMVKWENTFNMRAQNLNNFSTGNNNNCRGAYRSQVMVMQRARLGFVTSTAKSLDIVRQNLQKSINKEIDDILQKYLKKFFKMAIDNIKENNGEASVTDLHIQAVCRQILEEAKAMYQTTNVTANSTSSTHENPEPAVKNVSEHKPDRHTTKHVGRKRKDSDTDSDISAIIQKPKKKKGRPPIHYQGPPSGRTAAIKLKTKIPRRVGPKWDPERLTTNTEFIMGAKANKALGLGATRGRLYIKHPELFKYSGDQDDKQWLYDHNLMPATGGKAYMLLVEDMLELADTEEYRNSRTLMKSEIIGFTVPDFMLHKIKAYMKEMRTNTTVRKRGRPQATAPSATSSSPSDSNAKTEDASTGDQKFGSSRAITPMDDVDLLNADISSADPSPYSLGTTVDDTSPTRMDSSPSAQSEESVTLEPPLTAPFNVSNVM